MNKYKNRYFVLRHGHSLANEAGVILSHPETGKKKEYTLTKKGEDQVRDSVARAKASGLIGADTLIVSSPFSRCRRTAELAKEGLGVSAEIVFDDRLCERWFGDWEGTSNSNYERVWEDDKRDPGHTIANVESAAAVQARTLSLIRDLEEEHKGRVILLVSHGDALQILETGAKGLPASAHRGLDHLQTAEIRELHFARN